MQAAERRDRISVLARTEGLASVERLAETFGVSPSTIRRDLAHLELSQQIARTYGGAIALRPAHAEAALAERASQGAEAKRRLGRWAAQQVRPGETVALDAGTTMAQVAVHVREVRPLTVVTAGLTPFFEIGDVDGIERVLLGGSLREVSQGFVGPLTEEALERWTFDVAFLSADAVTAEHGICEASVAQTRLKRLIALASERVYLLVHADKIGARPFNSWVQLPIPWTLVTDSDASDRQLQPFRARGVEIVVLPGDSPGALS